MFVECAVCEEEFEAQRSSAKYCGDRCRQVANRRRRAGGSLEQAADHVDAEAEFAKNQAAGVTEKDSELVVAVRKQLADADRLNTIEGQSAVLLAKSASQAGATGISALIKELRVAVDDALEGAVLDITCVHCGKQAMKPDPLDDVAAARKKRAQKASAAAAR